MITIHHLQISQSERILWLMEELGLPYNLVLHKRAPSLAPDSLKNIPGNQTGKSPFIEDPDAGITLSESGAICDYIIQVYGDGRLAFKPSHKNFKDYLYWYHFANGTLQSEMLHVMFLSMQDGDANSKVKQFTRQRLNDAWKQLDDRLKDNKWLAGEEFTAADIMTVYCPTTQRMWGPQDDLGSYPNLLRYLKDVAQRPAYQRAMEKGDPDMKVYNEAEPPAMSLMVAGGVDSSIWRKS